MPELESAVDQPSAETESEQFTDNSLPADSNADSPSETQTADEAEGTESVESESEGDTEGTSETETESQPDEFLAGLTREELAYYAKRYPTLYKAYQDPNQPADLRQAFMDRVNQDHAYAELRDGQGEAEGEPTSEEAPAAVPDATEQRKQYYSQIDDIVSTVLDPKMLEEFGKSDFESFGLDPKSQDPDVQAILKNAGKRGASLARGAVDITATVLPKLLPGIIEQVMPGITEMYYENLYARTWEGLRARSVKLPDGTSSQPYAKLPAMGTPQWNSGIDKVLKEMPELREMFSELLPHQRIAKQYAIAAKLMSGQQVSPAVVAAAVDTGKKLARKQEVTRAAGRALGGGRSTQQLGQQSSDEDDPIMADLDRAIEQQNRAISPLSRPTKR
jgi:hypothetical protein